MTSAYFIINNCKKEWRDLVQQLQTLVSSNIEDFFTSSFTISIVNHLFVYLLITLYARIINIHIMLSTRYNRVINKLVIKSRVQIFAYLLLCIFLAMQFTAYANVFKVLLLMLTHILSFFTIVIYKQGCSFLEKDAYSIDDFEDRNIDILYLNEFKKKGKDYLNALGDIFINSTTFMMSILQLVPFIFYFIYKEHLGFFSEYGISAFTWFYWWSTFLVLCHIQLHNRPFTFKDSSVVDYYSKLVFLLLAVPLIYFALFNTIVSTDITFSFNISDSIGDSDINILVIMSLIVIVLQVLFDVLLFLV